MGAPRRCVVRRKCERHRRPVVLAAAVGVGVVWIGGGRILILVVQAVQVEVVGRAAELVLALERVGQTVDIGIGALQNREGAEPWGRAVVARGRCPCTLVTRAVCRSRRDLGIVRPRIGGGMQVYPEV